MRLIDADNLIAYANNQRDKTVDANDIARMPYMEAVPLVPLARWLAGYAFPPGLAARKCVGKSPEEIGKATIAAWEAILRTMDWRTAEHDD